MILDLRRRLINVCDLHRIGTCCVSPIQLITDHKRIYPVNFCYLYRYWHRHIRDSPFFRSLRAHRDGHAARRRLLCRQRMSDPGTQSGPADKIKGDLVCRLDLFILILQNSCDPVKSGLRVQRHVKSDGLGPVARKASETGVQGVACGVLDQRIFRHIRLIPVLADFHVCLYSHCTVRHRGICQIQRETFNVLIRFAAVQDQLHPVYLNTPPGGDGDRDYIFPELEFFQRDLKHGRVPRIIGSGQIPDSPVIIGVFVTVLLIHGVVNIVVDVYIVGLPGVLVHVVRFDRQVSALGGQFIQCKSDLYGMGRTPLGHAGINIPVAASGMGVVLIVLGDHQRLWMRLL